MKKLLRLAKEKRKEEKVLQKLLKMKGKMLRSPVVSVTFFNRYYRLSQTNHEKFNDLATNKQKIYFFHSYRLIRHTRRY